MRTGQGSAGLIQPALKAVRPGPKGFRIVRAQAFSIHQFQSRLRHVTGYFTQVNQFAAWKYIFFNKVPYSQSQLAITCTVGCDAMVHHHPPGGQQSIDFFEIAWHVCTTNVLEHAHRGDLVEGLRLI